MRQIGLGSYGKRVSRAAETLLEHQGFDGGWGLTLTSVLCRLATHGQGRERQTTCQQANPSPRSHPRPSRPAGHMRFVCGGLQGIYGLATARR